MGNCWRSFFLFLQKNNNDNLGWRTVGVALRASPRVCQNLLGKSCVLPTSKKLCNVKKEFISNSLA
jgi:hypothetical protein